MQKIFIMNGLHKITEIWRISSRQYVIFSRFRVISSANIQETMWRMTGIFHALAGCELCTTFPLGRGPCPLLGLLLRSSEMAKFFLEGVHLQRLSRPFLSTSYFLSFMYISHHLILFFCLKTAWGATFESLMLNLKEQGFFNITLLNVYRISRLARICVC